MLTLGRLAVGSDLPKQSGQRQPGPENRRVVPLTSFIEHTKAERGDIWFAHESRPLAFFAGFCRGAGAIGQGLD